MMHIVKLDYNSLFAAFSPDTVVITPNRRLAATLRELYQTYLSELHSSQGDKCWLTPDILPIFNWLSRLWNDFASGEFNTLPLLLNSVQEQFIWEKIIAQSKNSEQLLQVSETADLAKSAWGLLKQWQVNIAQSIFDRSEDYIAFKQWAYHFQKICQEENRIDGASLPDLLMMHIENKIIIPPKNILLLGFNELSPQLLSFFSICEKAGCCVNQIEKTEGEVNARKRKTYDEEAELFSMACFAKSHWDKNKRAKIGCVIPTLEQKRDRVRQIFSQVFADETHLRVDDETSPFNISAGKSLGSYPIIRTALLLLNLQKNQLPIETLSYLLSSPFLGGALKERFKRAKLDYILRKENINYIDFNEVKISSLFSSICPYLAKRIFDAFTLLKEKHERMSYCEWANFFNEFLSKLGWPGERSLNSEEYQTVEQWLQIFSQFITLDFLSLKVSYQQALQSLQKIVTKTVFQTKTPKAPIQVLGVLEASGLPFDYLWVAGMDDLAWPPQPRPNPFIPKSLQRELRMPHATAEREFAYCQEIIQQFKMNAQEVIFSYAEQRDELCLNASALIKDCQEWHENEDQFDYTQISQRIYTTKKIEILHDETAPPISADENIRGGVSILKQQALCPFKAFSEWRLHAEKLENPLPGLRAKDRGIIIHKALEIIWNQLQDHLTLNSIKDHALDSLLDESVIKAVQLFIPLGKHFFNLEKKRLKKLLFQWLTMEKDRPPFKVFTSEKSAQIQLNQLTLTLKIDRMDELEDGKKLIIDYKTGKNNDISTWFGERLEEPQLPLYSLLDEQNTVGICFAQFFPGENSFKGISHYDLNIPGIKLVENIKNISAKSWQEQVEEWKVILTQLSNDFYQGKADVDPKEAKQTCQWCSLQSFCRINEEIIEFV